MARHRNIASALRPLATLLALFAAAATAAHAQSLDRQDEIVANLAAGRVIVHVAANDTIIIAAINQPIEPGAPPPRLMSIDSTHVAILLGASEWRAPADPQPVRLDRGFQLIGRPDPRYQTYEGAEADLESMGESFLEKLHPLAAQLHNKLDFPPDQPVFDLVIIGFGPQGYGPEVWTAQYGLQQEQIASRNDYWQTRVLRPRFTQLYPPEKHDPHRIVETSYPPNAASAQPALSALIDAGDPRIAQLCASDQRFEKVAALLEKGQAQKAAPGDAADFLRALLPIVAPGKTFFLGTMTERGFDWIVPPEEPVERVKEDKNRPSEAPSLLRKPQR
jgi:hypothetical protein